MAANLMDMALLPVLRPRVMTSNMALLRSRATNSNTARPSSRATTSNTALLHNRAIASSMGRRRVMVASMDRLSSRDITAGTEPPRRFYQRSVQTTEFMTELVCAKCGRTGHITWKGTTEAKRVVEFSESLSRGPGPPVAF
jgi:hypothetical protein